MRVEAQRLSLVVVLSYLMAVVVAALVAGGAPLGAQEEATFIVVLNPSVPVESLSKQQVSEIFLKKVTRWRDGSAVMPVDLSSESPTRAGFSESIHGRQVSAIKSYWQRQIFSGRAVPPPERATDMDVLAFVRDSPGAIGYVSATAPVDELRVLRVTE